MTFGRRLNLTILEVFSKFIAFLKATRPPAGAPPAGAAGRGAQLLQQRSRLSSRALRPGGSHTSAFQPTNPITPPYPALCLPGIPVQRECALKPPGRAVAARCPAGCGARAQLGGASGL